MGPTIDISKFVSGFVLQWMFQFSMLKASVDLPPYLWLYAIPFHTYLGCHPDAKDPLMKILNYLSPPEVIKTRNLPSFE